MANPQLTAPQLRALRALTTLTTPQRRALRALVTLANNPVTRDQHGLPSSSASTKGLVYARCLRWVDEGCPGKGVLVTDLGHEVASLIAEIEASPPDGDAPEASPGAGRPAEHLWTEGLPDAPGDYWFYLVRGGRSRLEVGRSRVDGNGKLSHIADDFIYREELAAGRLRIWHTTLTFPGPPTFDRTCPRCQGRKTYGLRCYDCQGRGTI